MFVRLGFSLKTIVFDLIALYELCIIIRALLSWIAPYGGASRFLTRFTEPVINPVRNTLTRLIGSYRLDVSPAVTVLLLELLRRVIDTLFK